ncbi:DNA sulfur modification protein DndB [Streptomyces sp. NPDC093984]|uniref:DNA sulfur modification protein DndB n=1 Tax=Streptomyces sp. NPDC093984 TaxID=3366052 RepID=UPI00380AD16B
MSDSTSLDDIDTFDLRSFSFETLAFKTEVGEMPTFTFTLAVPDLLRLVKELGLVVRNNFSLDSDGYGNRPLDKKHVARIAAGLTERPDTPIQMITLAIPGELNGAPTHKWTRARARTSGPVELGQFRMYQDVTAHIQNGQHTLAALESVMDGDAVEAKEVLVRSSVPIQVLVQSDRNEVNRIFVIAGQTKPISPALIAALDQSSYANRLGVQVGRSARIFTDDSERLVYLSSSASQGALYSTAHVRGFSAAIYIGFKDRTPDAREANFRKVLEERCDGGGSLDKELDVVVNEIVEVLDYAYGRVPGWRELQRGELTPKEFRATYLHGAPAGLYVIGGVLGAARFCGVPLPKVVDALATLEWQRAAHELDKDGKAVHPVFDGTLVRFEEVQRDDGTSEWAPTTTGGARTNYEAATERLLGLLSHMDSSFAGLTSPSTLRHLGLRAAARRGRPRKNPTGPA